MLRGRLMLMGTFQAEGDTYHGVVVEVGKDALRNTEAWDPRLYEDVLVVAPASASALRDLEQIEEFVAEVCRRAEANMLKTGKLEGAHYAAMRAVLEERRAKLVE